MLPSLSSRSFCRWLRRSLRVRLSASALLTSIDLSSSISSNSRRFLFHSPMDQVILVAAVTYHTFIKHLSHTYHKYYLLYMSIYLLLYFDVFQLVLLRQPIDWVHLTPTTTKSVLEIFSHPVKLLLTPDWPAQWVAYLETGSQSRKVPSELLNADREVASLSTTFEGKQFQSSEALTATECS